MARQQNIPPYARFKQNVRRFVEWVCFDRAFGFWAIGVVLILAGGRVGWLWHIHQRNMEIADAFGSVGSLYGTPQSSADGNNVSFVQTTTNGIGVFIVSTTTKEKTLVFEERGSLKGGSQDLTVWPWSPDSRHMIYTRNGIYICDGSTGTEQEKVGLGKNQIKSLMWINNSTKFLYSCTDGTLHLVEQQPSTKWKQTLIDGVKVDAAFICKLSKQTIAYAKAGGVWTLDLDSRQVTQIYKCPAAQLLDSADYSEHCGQFLLKLKSQRQTNEAALWQLQPGKSPEKITACPYNATDVHWLGVTNKSWAYLSLPTTNSPANVLTIQCGTNAESTMLFTNETAQSLTTSADGQAMFAIGLAGNELAEAVWKYDVQSKNLDCIVHSTDHPSQYARHLDYKHETLILASGETADYFVYEPIDLTSHPNKKYQLILGDTLFKTVDAENQGRIHGPLWMQAAACCGAYAVVVNRTSWFKGIDQWKTNVLQVLRQLSLNPSIDMNQVYLFGGSAETSPISNLANEQPELWNGLLLLNPSRLPKISSMPPRKKAPKILISAGDAEKSEERLNMYKMEAGQNGVSVSVIIHPDSSHWLISMNAMQQRTQAIINFVFNP